MRSTVGQEQIQISGSILKPKSYKLSCSDGGRWGKQHNAEADHRALGLPSVPEAKASATDEVPSGILHPLQLPVQQSPGPCRSASHLLAHCMSQILLGHSGAWDVWAASLSSPIPSLCGASNPFLQRGAQRSMAKKKEEISLSPVYGYIKQREEIREYQTN